MKISLLALIVSFSCILLSFQSQIDMLTIIKEDVKETKINCKKKINLR